MSIANGDLYGQYLSGQMGPSIKSLNQVLPMQQAVQQQMFQQQPQAQQTGLLNFLRMLGGP